MAVATNDICYDDMVLSSVHIGKAESSVLKSELTTTKFKFETIGEKQMNDHAAIDEDGDFVVQRNFIKHEEIIIYHQMGTPLSDVGMQVWLGSLLLADWILHNPSLFIDTICLELGAGTGLCSILAGMFCKIVFCTDTGESVLKLCQENIQRNIRLLKKGHASVIVKDLNWLSLAYNFRENDTDANNFDWRSQEIDELKHVTILLAADVVYDNVLTDAFFNKVVTVMENNRNQQVLLLISVEKRLNFTVDDLDVTSHAYNHFRKKLADLECNHFNGDSRFYEVKQLDVDFPKYFEYERSKELELWQVFGTKC